VDAEAYVAKGLNHFYNLEYEEAVAAYQAALALEPSNAHIWTRLAHAYLFRQLHRAGRLDAQLYAASNEFTRGKPPEPDPELNRAMWEALGRARELVEQRLKENPRDAGAHFALGMSYAVESNYHLNLDRKYWDALRAGARAKDHHVRARELDPANHDANLLIGLYDYAIGSLPGPARFLVYLAGHSGSKERGVASILDTMQHGRQYSTAAVAILAVIYNRERMYSYSRQMLQHLMRFFPRNYLYEMELARSYQREGHLAAAIEALKNVARKAESGAPGFAGVDAMRLHFEIASLLERQDRPAEALAHYERVAARRGEEALLAQSYLRMGEIYRGQRDTQKAREMFEKARALPVPEVQRQAAARLRSLGN
jgi:tetratricopeptide (TPR) repeat protein